MIGPYVKINPNERPTEYWARVQRADSDGGARVTKKEAAEGHALLNTWEREQFVRLTTLPSQQLAREVGAIRAIQKLPEENWKFPFVIGGVMTFETTVALVTTVMLGGVVVVTAQAIKHGKNKMIDTILQKLSELDSKREKKEISQADYERERRKIVEEAIRSP